MQTTLRSFCNFVFVVAVLLSEQVYTRLVRTPVSYPRSHSEVVLTREQCRRIRSKALKELHFVKAKIGSGNAEDERLMASPEVRRAEYAGIPRQHRFFGQLYNQLWKFANDSNEELWRFAIAPETMEIMQYSIYRSEDRGMYDWHEDIGFHSSTSSRVLSLTLQLSPEEEYAGGELTFRVGRQDILADRRVGTATIFPSHVTHRVAPVSRGERHSVVLWLQLDISAGDDTDVITSDVGPGAMYRNTTGVANEADTICSIKVDMPSGESYTLEWRERDGTPEKISEAFCRLKGVPERFIPSAVAQIAKSLRDHCAL